VADASLSARLEGLPAGEVALAFRPDGELLLAASGREVRAFDPRDGKLLAARPRAAGAVHALAFSPDGARIAAGLANNTLEVWHAESGEVLLRVPYSAGVWQVAWSRDGEELFALPMDETVRVLGAGGG
jgi:WD40 repeat protein